MAAHRYLVVAMSNKHSKSEAAFERACNVLVGGVNSPVRAFSSVEMNPPFISRASGATVTDIDGNEYVDYVASYGPAILGHAHEQVVTSISKAVRHGTSYGAPTESETLLAEAITQAYPTIEKVRFVNSGTEAVMTAVRLARGVTGRDKIVKCIGCYHGHSDAMLVSAGSGAATLGVPSSPGVPAGATAETLLVPYNDAAAVRKALAEHEVAAVLVEPIAGNMGCVPPAQGYLQSLREACDASGALLIFDEVMTGFRVAYGGAQELYGVSGDLTCLGKVIGGGMPVGAVGGPAGLMDHLSPVGPVYQAGTLSGNPVAMAAGLACLQALQADDAYEQLEKTSSQLAEALRSAADTVGVAQSVCVQRVGSMMCCYFHPGPVVNYDDAAAGNRKAFNAWFAAMLEEGIYLAPSPFEAMFVSLAHGEKTTQATAKAARVAFAAARKHLS
jgi:glutamate-1-semialdehyde 2,1-aminomutase